MADKDFDFDKIGKPAPFTVPEDFYSKMQDKVMADIHSSKRRTMTLRILTAATAGVAAILGCVFFIPQDKTVSVPSSSKDMIVKTNNMDNTLSQMSDEELNEWMQISENDIFIY